MSEYEKVYFDKWQDLAKAVIDGREIYFFKHFDGNYIKITFSGMSFCVDMPVIFNDRDIYIKKQPTLAELIAIKPRLCWVWEELECKKEIRLVDKYNYNYIMAGYYYKILTDEEIKQFLNGE